MNLPTSIGVVGLGTIGSQELALWRQAGFTACGYDISEQRVEELRAAHSGDALVHITSSLADLVGCEVLVICLPNLSPEGDPSIDVFEKFFDGLAASRLRPSLIILTSTVPIGYTRKVAERFGELGTLVAHAPERYDPGRGLDLEAIPRVAGSTTAQGLELTADLYRTAGVKIMAVETVEIAEASKLLENSFRLINIAFIKEFAELCRRIGISAAAVVDAAASKPFAFLAHYPSVGAGGECIPTMPRFLLRTAAEQELDLPILRTALTSNDEVADRVTDHLRTLLKRSEVDNGSVLIAGVTYKPNYPAIRGSAALRLAQRLSSHYAVTVFDPVVEDTNHAASLNLCKEIPAGQSFDAVIVAVAHQEFNMSRLRALSPIFMDLTRGEVEVTGSVTSLNQP
jgi:UDP-N-acetyl-D-glucosamine dehydrogenase